MNSFTMIKTFLAVMISVVVFYLSYNFLNSYESDSTIVVAKTEIKDGELINPNMLLLKKVRTKEVDIIAPNAARTFEELKNSLSTNYISPGDVIDKERDVLKIDELGTSKGQSGSASKKGKVSQSYFIDQEQRLVGIRLDAASAVSNLLRKNDYVDVLATYKTSIGSMVTLILEQRVEVHDVQQIDDKKIGREEQTIVLKINAKKAGDLIWVKHNGKIDLVLSSVQAKKEITTPINELSVFNKVLGSQ